MNLDDLERLIADRWFVELLDQCEEVQETDEGIVYRINRYGAGEAGNPAFTLDLETFEALLQRTRALRDSLPRLREAEKLLREARPMVEAAKEHFDRLKSSFVESMNYDAACRSRDNESAARNLAARIDEHLEGA